MYRSRSRPLVLLVAINFLLNSPTNAGVVKRSVRMVREVYPPDIEPENEGNQPQVCIVGDVVYGTDEAVPAEQPCLKCRCQPPGVQCETVQCAKKPGCKAIHRPNKCCPDYQCECEHDGKIYANGEKLETNPGGECKVCYCRGGEVQCAEVSCYIRKDCEGKRVPGTCCPRYDNCPPVDPLPDRTYLTTEPPLNTLKPVVLELWQESTNSTDIPSLPTLSSIPEDSNKVPDTSDSATVSPTFQEIPKKDEGMLPRITIQEIIPERKEIPITAPPKTLISKTQGTLLIEEALPTNENTSNDLNIDSEPDSSEISEVFQHPPPVLRIGDKLLFLKKGELVPEKDTNTPQSVITIIGAEGLQRGGVEESLEVHEVKIQPDSDVQDGEQESDNGNVKIESKIEYIDNQNTLENVSNKPETKTSTQNNSHSDDDQSSGSATNDLELKTAGSTHILSLVKKKNKNGSSTTSTTTQEPTTVKEDGLTTLTSSIEEPRPSETSKLLTESVVSSGTTIKPIFNETKAPESTPDPSTTLLGVPEPTTEPQTKNTEPVSEQNPAYPPLPDIMPAVGDASQKFEIELENDNATTMEIKILPEVFNLLSNKTRNQTYIGNSEWLKSYENKESNDTLVNFQAATLPDELLNQKSPIDEDDESSTNTAEVTTLESQTKPTESETTTKAVSNSDVEKTVISLSEQQSEMAGNEHIEHNKPKSEEKKVKKDKLEEEGAQLIAEVKINGDMVEFDPVTTPLIISTEVHPKIIKENEEKPSIEIIKKASETLRDSANPQKSLVEFVKTLDKSVESLEVDSGEQTTPKSNHSSMVSNENASVEKLEKESNSDNSETNDMIQNSTKEVNIELGSVELSESSTSSILADIEILETSTKNSVDARNNQTNGSENAMKQDVELINVMNIPKPTKMDKVESSTYELLPTPEETKSRSIIKREIASENSHEDVFEALEKELNAEKEFSKIRDPDDENSEADEIFKELENEAKGTKVNTIPKSKEQEKADNLSNALGGFVLKGRPLDPNIFRLIGGLLRGERE